MKVGYLTVRTAEIASRLTLFTARSKPARRLRRCIRRKQTGKRRGTHRGCGEVVDTPDHTHARGGQWTRRQESSEQSGLGASDQLGRHPDKRRVTDTRHAQREEVYEEQKSTHSGSSSLRASRRLEMHILTLMSQQLLLAPRHSVRGADTD